MGSGHLPSYFRLLVGGAPRHFVSIVLARDTSGHLLVFCKEGWLVRFAAEAA
jgi:hypothetical protein